MQEIPRNDLVAAFVPTGRLRASIYTRNPILASLDPPTGSTKGVSVDLARGFAERLRVREGIRFMKASGFVAGATAAPAASA